MGFGIGETLLVLGIVLLLFGGKRLPQLGSSLGKAIQNFKKGMDEKDDPRIENENKDDDIDKKTLK